ncbi:MAG: Acryloyl-CoA reductase electron transfer subunit beta [Syntrophorhabdus sp. PtaU1.Bin058]|nr:MAG: Acryloyl-CoA reductase electron transfer subunit beta [Syntrophorhabdus sp. PtaU1.Bin058]
MADLKGILVVGELGKEGLASITRELLGVARELLDVAEGEVNLMLIGEDVSSYAEEGIAFGADKVYVVNDVSAQEFPCDFYTHAVDQFCRKAGISLCLMGHTDLGRELAPRAAARLRGCICMDCVEIRSDVKEKEFVQLRPVFGGKAMAETASQRGVIQIVTVRHKSMSGFVHRSDRRGDIIDWSDQLQKGPVRTRLIERKTEEQEGVNIENAPIIVAGGGGIGGKEGFELIRELGRLLKGAVGASRVPVDEGWVHHNIEIGQTGKIVSPDIYVAVAISGATQHITGILGSKCIVAVNKDPDANIFKVSDVGVVADYKELLPYVIEHLRGASK